MPLLAAGNTEFATSVTRKWSPHYKSKSIDLLEVALLAVQNAPGNARNLEFLYGQLVRWVQGNPNEFAKRGRLVGKLAYEIERKAQQLGLSVAAEAGRLRAATTGSAATMWTLLTELGVPIAAHNAEWDITITDHPTGVHGVYNHTPEDRYSLEDRVAALGEMGGAVHNPNTNGRFWLRLGRHALTARADGHRYGRCYSCAAAAIHTLVSDPAFDNYTIEHVAATGFDHHLVVLGRSNATGTSDAGLNPGWEQWKWSGIIIDVWDENRVGTTQFARVARLNQYTGGVLTWYCAYTPANRAADRAFIGALGPLVRVAAQPVMVAAARVAVANQGRPTRTIPGPPRVDNTGRVRPTFVTEEQQVDGSWVRI